MAWWRSLAAQWNDLAWWRSLAAQWNDLARWRSLGAQWNEVSLLQEPEHASPVRLETDTSGTWDAGGWSGSQWFQMSGQSQPTWP